MLDGNLDMKARSLEEIEAVLASESFRTWWGDLEAFTAEKREIERRLEEISEKLFRLEAGAERSQRTAIDKVQDASEVEHALATLHAEASEIENRAIGKLGGYEEQRFKASDAWVKLGAIEKRLEEATEKLESTKKEGARDTSRLQAEIERLVREQRAAHELYEKESARKKRLWGEVEKLWSAALEKGLNAKEQEARNSAEKRKAERLLRSSDQDQVEVERLRGQMAELEEKLSGLRDRIRHCRADAAELFGAIVGEDFIYWPCSAPEKHVWCLSLVADSETYNIEVLPGTVYRARADEGAGHLEPLGSEVEGLHGEDRIEAWFRHGKIGPAQPEETGTAEDRSETLQCKEVAGKATGGG